MAEQLHAAEQRKSPGATPETARSRKMSVILKDAVLGRPLDDRSIEPPILGASESCWLCHTHDDGETVCHPIVCPT
jgi:hypothetical protein